MDKIKCRVKDVGKIVLDPRTFCPVRDMILEVRIEYQSEQDSLGPEEQKKRFKDKIGEIIYNAIEAARVAANDCKAELYVGRIKI